MRSTIVWLVLFAAGSWQNANGKPTADVVAYFKGSQLAPARLERRTGAGRGSATRRHWRSSAASSMPAARSPAPAETRRPTSQRRGRSGCPTPRSASPPGATSATTSTTSPAPARRRRSRSHAAPAQFFPVLVQNDGVLPASFKLKGTGAATGYTVTYVNYANGANITAAVRKGSSRPERSRRVRASR